MEERFNYVIDTVSTEEYYSAINKISNVTWWVPAEPLSHFELEIGVLSLLPELRKIILAAGKFTGLREHKERHYYIQSSSTPRILLEPFRAKNSSQWMRLCIDRNPTRDLAKKNKIDFYIPEKNDDTSLDNIQMFEFIGANTQRLYPAREIGTEEGQLNAKKFIALWQEGLRHLLGMIRDPIDFSKLPPEAQENMTF